jgi:hypothetical protein
MRFSLWLALLLMVSGLPQGCDAGQTRQAETAESALRFVQRFYDGYVLTTQRYSSGPAWNSLLEDESSGITRELRLELKADSDAQDRTEGEIVGLDFDPILNTQDPCQRYEVGKAARTADGYSVDVYAVCDGTRDSTRDVIAEVVYRGDSWEAANFRYPDNNSNLRSILNLLRNDRQKQ